MHIPITSRATFREHLGALGITAGARICVHARLISFGHLTAGVESVLEDLRNTVGPTGTIAVPTFTLNLREDGVFDPSITAPDGVGALSNHLWKLPGAIRSRCPVHSYAAIGPDAKVIGNANPGNSFGPGSAFDLLQRQKFSLLLLGCNFTEGATFAHHVEADVGVPYREWIDLPRRVRSSNGQVQDLSVRYYARMRHLNGENDLSRIETAAEQQCGEAFVPIAGSNRRSALLDLRVLDSIVRDVIRQDPYAMFRLKRG